MRRRTDVDDGGWNAPHGGRRPPEPKRRSRRSLGRRITAWVAVGLAAVLVAGALGAYVKYRAVWDSIKRVDVAGLIGQQPPKYNNNAENILLIGSDTRVGKNGNIGGNTGCNCSDTLMVLHISPGHHEATVISIPRETMVPILQCAASDGTPGQSAGSVGELELINAALSAGGPACTWKTVDAVTGIHLDHFIELDFTGFEKVINDLGGVEICLPFAVHDPQSNLSLPAGVHHVFGPEALAFWRTREGVGEGSDTQRIQRDQFLMASLVQGIEHSNLLGSPTRMLEVIRDAANAMTTDTGLDQSAMLQIAGSLRGLSSKSVQFVTAPNVPWPPNVNDVEFQQPQADQLFNAIAHDNVLPAATKKPAAAKPAPVVKISPAQVKIEVENGSGVAGIASQAASALTAKGFSVVGTGDAPSFGFTSSQIEYATSADLPAANTLKAQLNNAQVSKNTTLSPGTVLLIVGSSFHGLGAAPTAPKQSISRIGAADGAINGNINICKNHAAFAGPDSPSI
jgi:LCP family protein required for cell wall assembly